MKYIKLFENNEYKKLGKFWKIKIRNSPRKTVNNIEVYFDKIGMDEANIKFWKPMLKFIGDINDPKRDNYRFFIKDEPGEWTHGSVGTFNKIVDDYDYMGEVTITRDDIENYRMKQTASKYNL